jgi:hypothetical protein
MLLEASMDRKSWLEGKCAPGQPASRGFNQNRAKQICRLNLLLVFLFARGEKIRLNWDFTSLNACNYILTNRCIKLASFRLDAIGGAS